MSGSKLLFDTNAVLLILGSEKVFSSLEGKEGYQEISRELFSLSTKGDIQIPCLLFDFKSSQFGGNHQIVLVSYLINGQYTNDTEAAQQYNTRNALLWQKKNCFVSRIQISMQPTGNRTDDRAVLSEFAKKLIPTIGDMMPRNSQEKAVRLSS